MERAKNWSRRLEADADERRNKRMRRRERKGKTTIHRRRGATRPTQRQRRSSCGTSCARSGRRQSRNNDRRRYHRARLSLKSFCCAKRRMGATSFPLYRGASCAKKPSGIPATAINRRSIPRRLKVSFAGAWSGDRRSLPGQKPVTMKLCAKQAKNYSPAHRDERTRQIGRASCRERV